MVVELKEEKKKKKERKPKNMRTVYSKDGNLTNLRFCHCSQVRTLTPKSSFLVSLIQVPNFTLSITTKTFPFRSSSILCGINRRCVNNNYRRWVIRASMASSTSSPTQRERFSVLFVCLGNICRSPAAEGVFQDLVKKRGLDSKFNIDSCGTIDYHEGNEADPRMREASKKRGIQITSISRPIKPSDFVDFDLILAMDMQNREDILESFNSWRARYKLPDDAHKKVKLMCSYCKKHDESEVPDPYYGGPQGFEKVLDLLEDACGSLLENILAENEHVRQS
ncbi:hypothetical protein HN51_009818 [Arachis hypogaea]|uniref:acid phosphatase n=1 Tax=Arachis hypogaea TaxID=3818 RepID=A0A445E581_ARAHY|nr:Putative low molecular weight protein-tyrosine-phosphatase [Arachis hypogaea]RYR70523.1 hypothetical protein Ahy_A03g017007 [Arachis hypogaea]